MAGMNLTSFLTILFTAVLGSGGTVGALKLIADHLANRRGARAEATHIEVITEQDRAASLKKWQDILDERADLAFTNVKAECDACKEEVSGMKDICGNLIDAMEALMAEDTAQSRADARASIRLARRAM